MSLLGRLFSALRRSRAQAEPEGDNEAPAVATASASERPDDGAARLVLQLSTGRVVIATRPDLAPKTVARILELAGQGFYDGTPFHRVIAGFMAQGGDPTGTGRGGSGQRLAAEFSREPHVRGTVSMARAQHPDSADSQFFICFAEQPSLDGQYTVWGRVIEGMEHVDALRRGEIQANGIVDQPDVVVWMKPAGALDEAP